MKINIYSEDVPVKSCSTASGLSKAMVCFYRELVKESCVFFAGNQAHLNLTNDEIDVEMFPRSWQSGRFMYALQRMCVRAPFKIRLALNYYLAAYIYLCIRNKIVDGPLFAPVGVDTNTLLRFNFLRRFLGTQGVLYLVDDLYLHSTNSKLSRAEKEYTKSIIRNADKVLFITAALKRKFAREIGGNSLLTMPLAFDPIQGQCDKNSIKNNVSISFLGNVNELYLPGLLDLIELIELYEFPIDLKLTKRFSGENKYLNNARCISFHSVTDEGMCEFIQKSTVSFMPYGISDAMSETSFPSKLLTYLAYSKYIIFYTRGVNSVTSFCSENGVPNIIESKSALLECITGLTKDSVVDHSRIYYDALSRNFSSKAIVANFRRSI